MPKFKPGDIVLTTYESIPEICDESKYINLILEIVDKNCYMCQEIYSTNKNKYYDDVLLGIATIDENSVLIENKIWKILYGLV